jgi:uncharacterized protein
LTSSARTRSELGSAGAYVDTSALTKLVITEPHSAAMHEAFRATAFTSSAVIVTEFVRAVRRSDPRATAQATERLDRIATVAVNDDILMLAGAIEPPQLRSLDAIHLATALILHPVVSPLITYDRSLAAAATAFGLQVASPR